MKRTLLIIMLTLILSSCPVEYYEKLDSLIKRDRVPPVMVSFTLSDNRKLSLRFSEPCTIEDIRTEEMFIPHNDWETAHHLCTMFSPILPGEEHTLMLTVKDRAGNTSRYHTHITGVNLNVPSALITEVSAAGTQTSPDRIEITFRSEGTTDGLCVSDGALGSEKHRYYLPHLEVNKNDAVVIWWDREPQDRETIIRDMNKTYILYAGSEDTLSSTNGSVILWRHTNGEGQVMDALLWNRSDAELSDGFGNNRSRDTYKKMVEKEEWRNGTVESDRLTSSRVFSRYYPYEDTDMSGDWYISAPRKSSFGWPNNNVEYIEE